MDMVLEVNSYNSNLQSIETDFESVGICLISKGFLNGTT